jgi:large subunit ribosomal protein L2
MLRHFCRPAGGILHQATARPSAFGFTGVNSYARNVSPALVAVRHFSNSYSPLVDRNRVPFVDFETGFPKQQLPAPTVNGPFTLTKQKNILKLLGDTPQLPFRGRVISRLSTRLIKHNGRRATGQISVRHKGGGHQQRLRFVDFKRGRKDIPATILRIEYAPCRTCYLALVQYEDGVLSYIIAPFASRPGDVVIASASANIAPGNCLPLRNIPVGSVIHNIELRPGAGGQVARAAGTYATVLGIDEHYATLRLRSTEIRKFPVECWASIGQVSNSGQANKIWGKAGASRWRGIRPSVRGNAMNMSSHPMGGGSSAKHGSRYPCTPWGVLRAGFKTRAYRKPFGLIVRRRVCGTMQKKYGMK